jgi:hypothetical protein
MKTLILFLLLFPIYSYSQQVGEKLTQKESLALVEKDHCNKYYYTSEDSIITIRTRKSDDLIWDIDYQVKRTSKLSWVTQYTQIGRNVFYDEGDYYFVFIIGEYYLIQIRNAEKVSSL